jgi:hypothetical protein
MLAGVERDYCRLAYPHGHRTVEVAAFVSEGHIHSEVAEAPSFGPGGPEKQQTGHMRLALC